MELSTDLIRRWAEQEERRQNRICKWCGEKVGVAGVFHEIACEKRPKPENSKPIRIVKPGRYEG